MKIGIVGCGMVGLLLHDQRAILTICSRIEGVSGLDGVTMAMPHLVGGAGALTTIPLTLDPVEQEALCQSAGVVRTAIESLNLQRGVA